MAVAGSFLRIPGKAHWWWMLEPQNRTNRSHKQWVAAFLNTAAFFSRKLKIARSLQAGFTLSFLPHPFFCFIQGFCMSMTPRYYFRGKVHWRNISFPSPTFTPDVLNCPNCFILRELTGIFRHPCHPHLLHSFWEKSTPSTLQARIYNY